MEKKLKKGDKVRMRRTVCFDYITFEKDCVGEVTSGETNRGFCCVKMTNAENGKMIEHFICANNLELIDSKTAFLSELKGLLEKHGAELGDSGMYEIEGMEVTFDNGDRIRYKHSTINALNIMDYDKE